MKLRAMNLDGNFVPFPVPEIKYRIQNFPGGEVHIQLNTVTDYSKIEKVLITHRMKTGQDFMEIVMAWDALQRAGIKHFELCLPYLPYSRQDRVCAPGQAFSLEAFGFLLNEMGFERVFTWDAHSIIAESVVNNLIDISPVLLIEQAIEEFPTESIIYVVPDEGASKKAFTYFEEVGAVRNTYKGLRGNKRFNSMIFCSKHRNPVSGKLDGFSIQHADDLDGKPCMIVDDICDGGGTFLGLAEELKKKNCGDLYLFVTHGIFSKGVDTLMNVFRKIYTTNSIDNPDHSFINRINLNLDEQFADK